MSQGAWTDIYALSAVIHVVIAGRRRRNAVDRWGWNVVVDEQLTIHQ